MQGDSTPVLANSAADHVHTTASTRVLPHEGGDAAASCGGDGGGGGGSNSVEDRAVIVDETEHMSYGTNRWPRQETLALLKIRSDMDEVFRDSNLKGPLWEEVSRKLGELGYHRSAKKCKEKFENVYKYHKRTKDGRTGKSQAKTYRFFDQLEAFEAHHQSQLPPAKPPISKPQPVTTMTTTTTTTAAATLPWINPPNITHATLPSTTNHPVIINPSTDDTAIDPMPLSSSQPLLNSSHQNIIMFATPYQNFTSHLFSSSTSSSTASDEELQGNRKRKRRYWKDFFERLTKRVIRKQEELQAKFLEADEKREQERIAREEAWRVQEMARINREHEMLIQERTTAAAKDAAVVALLQKISGDQNNSIQLPDIPALASTQPPPPPTLAPIPVTVAQPRPPPPPTKSDNSRKDDGQGYNAIVASSSRWPKIEVEALIRLRTNLDSKYQENGPKGPLWEEMSAGMQKLGYNRSAKRCKEKWENINKYFKKVTESNKKKIRSQDSKTCPYYHLLEALYKEKSISTITHNNSSVTPANLNPIITTPVRDQHQHVAVGGSENIHHDIKEDDDGNTEEEEEDEEEEEGGVDGASS